MYFKRLERAVEKDAAIRRVAKMQPIGGQGDKIFPTGHPGEGKDDGPRHVFERRRVGNTDVMCALLDSTQSQANRMEEALLERADREHEDDPVPIPYASVDFSGLGLEPLVRRTTLEAPHRVYDAVFRDSTLDGVPFMESPVGRRLAAARTRDATVLAEVAPAALVFGAWHSQGQKSDPQARFKRAVVSEIMAVGTPCEEVVVNSRTGATEIRSAARHTGSRIDDLGILRGVEVYKTPQGWDTTQAGAGKGAKKARPAQINHGNIPPTVQPLGVTCDYAEQHVSVSFNALRPLRFGSKERSRAGRTLIAALGLFAITEQDARGYGLRSRCDLVLDGRTPFEILDGYNGAEPVEIDREAAEALYREAYARCEALGFDFQWLTLKPQPKLVEIKRASLRLALEGGEDANGEDA